MSEYERAKAAIDTAQANRQRLISSRDVGVNDVDLPVRLLTGQLEALGLLPAAPFEPHPLGGDADAHAGALDAVLLPGDVVETVNVTLRKLNGTRIDSLNAIREARKVRRGASERVVGRAKRAPEASAAAPVATDS